MVRRIERREEDEREKEERRRGDVEEGVSKGD